MKEHIVQALEISARCPFPLSSEDIVDPQIQILTAVRRRAPRRTSEVIDMAETTDHSILKKIEGLVHEEQHLYGKSELADHDQVRLEDIKIELDQCWDLLRQREARREFGQDPNQAKMRPPSVVERYKQ
jgi:hypothetical protein